jgi:DNA-binding winged helix-turn-helix (wHTH) protein
MGRQPGRASHVEYYRSACGRRVSGFVQEFSNAAEDAVIFRFGGYQLDPATRLLTRRDGGVVALSRKAFDLLLALVEERPNVVLKDDLRQRLWGSTQVVDANLNNLVSEIRVALDDDAKQPRFLRTVHRVGYAFHGDVAAGDSGDAAPAAAGQARCWLVWRERSFVLAAPETVIGRDPQCAVWIDVPGISRRHARVRLTQEAGTAPSAVIEDLGSTNGTYVDGARLTTSRALADGTTIKVGEASLTFRMWSADGSPTRRVNRRTSRAR